MPAEGESQGLFIDSDDLQACSFERWYEAFRTGGKFTFRSVVIPLAQDFVDYLKEDGIRLPRAPRGVDKLRPRDPRSVKAIVKGDDESDWGSGSDDSDVEEHIPREFGELEARIEGAVELLKGDVFAKLNWTSPRDAAYMGGGTLACATPGEVFLLLKASDFCQNDVRLFQRTGVRPVLVLRKHIENLNPALEFRCFVRESRLLFVCQRDTSRTYPYLLQAEMQQNIVRQVSLFLQGVVLPRFPLGDFIMDVYLEVTSQKPLGKCWLVDLAPLPRQREIITEVLGDSATEDISDIPPHPLVTWNEIFSGEVLAAPEIKIVRGESETDSSDQKAMAMNRVPLDLVNGTLTTETMEEAFQRFRSMSINE